MLSNLELTNHIAECVDPYFPYCPRTVDNIVNPLTYTRELFTCILVQVYTRSCLVTVQACYNIFYQIARIHIIIITQYGSTDCHGWSSIIAIRKEISIFSFNITLSSKDIKVENM